jgi:hypothetical protein
MVYPRRVNEKIPVNGFETKNGENNFKIMRTAGFLRGISGPVSLLI